MTVYNAVLEVGGEIFHFSSLDGEVWLPVTRPGMDGEEQTVTDLIEGDGHFRPTPYTRAHLEEQGALFTTNSQTENGGGE